MADNKIRLQDIPSGHDGTGFITIGGRVLSAFRIAKVSGKAETEVDNKRFLGERVEQNAVRGLKVSGDLEYYHYSSAFIEAVAAYKDGADFPEITVQYEAHNSAAGRCEVLLTGVIPKEIPFGTLDDGSNDAIKITTTFTANDFQIINKFNQ